MPSLTGGCLCGRIRYAAAGEPIRSSISIAETASVYTGSAFEPFAMFPTASVTVAGELELSNTMATQDDPCAAAFAQTVDQASSASIQRMTSRSFGRNIGRSLPVLADDRDMLRYRADWVSSGDDRQRFPGMPG